MRVLHVFGVVCVCFFIFPAALSADDYAIAWQDTLDTGEWNGASDVAVDHAGNIIVFGSAFIGSNNDYVIVKYDSAANVLWQDTLDNGDEESAEAVAVDDADNIVITGYSRIAGDYDYYTVKYDSSGTILWQRLLDHDGDFDIARGVAVDNSQNIVVTGYCDIGNDCVYLTVKYDPAGNIIWTDTLSHGFFDSALDVAVDNLNNVIVTGYTSDGTDNDYFTVKYDSTGTIVWQDVIDIHQFDQAYGIAADNSNNVIVTGCSGEALDDYDMYTVKYDSSGNVLWIDTLDYESHDDVAYDVAVDDDNNIFVTGYTLALSGTYDFFTVKYDSSANVLWQGILNNGDDDIAHGVAVDDNDNLIVTGWSYINGDMDYLTVKYAPVQGISEYREQRVHYRVITVSPNPFKEKTDIIWQMTNKVDSRQKSVVSIGIYDITGRLVKNFPLSTPYSIHPTILSWDGTDNSGNRLPTGVYLLTIEQDKHRVTEKLLMVR